MKMSIQVLSFKCFLFIYLFVCLFVYLLRDHARVTGGGAEREGERIPSRVHAVSRIPDMGLKLTNHE